MEPTERYAVASAVGATGVLHIWEGTDGAPRRVASGATIAGAASLTAQYNGARLLALVQSRGGGTTLATYDTARGSGGPAARCGAPETSLTCVTASHGHAFVAAGGVSGRLYLWAAGGGALLARADAHLGGVTALAFTPDDALLLTAGADGAVHAWDVVALGALRRDRAAAPRPRASLRAHALPVRALAVGVGGAAARVVTAAADRSLRVWHLGSGATAGHVVLPCAPVAAALAPGEADAFAGLADGRVVAVHLPALPADAPASAAGMRATRAPGANVAVTALALAPAGRDLVVGYSDGQVRTYCAQSLALLRSYAKHVGGPVTALAVLFPIPDTLRDAPPQVRGRGGKVAVDAAAVVAEWPAFAAAALPLPAFSKVEHPGGEAEFSATVPFCAVVDPIAEAWAAIDAVSAAKGSTAAVRGSAPQEDAAVEKDVAEVPVHVLKELEVLRARNRELEEAGRKLCDMVEMSGQWET